MSSPSPLEVERLRALRRTGILDAGPDPILDGLTALAARLFDVPIAVVAYVDEDRIQVQSAVGIEPGDGPRDPGLCATTILGGGVRHLEDTWADSALRMNAVVRAGVRFYAGAALTTPDGHNIGSFCVMDREPRELSAEEQRLLETFADLTMGVVARHGDLMEEGRRADAIQRGRNEARHDGLGALAGGIAHDFNNVLSSILGNSELARRATDEEERAGYLDNVDRATHRAAGLCDHLLAYTGRVVGSFEGTDLGRLVTRIGSDVGCGTAGGEGVRVECEPGLVVEGDPDMLQTAIGNVLRNALESVRAEDPGEAPRAGRSPVTLRVEASTRGDLDPLYDFLPEGQEDVVLVTVEDRGVGMESEERDRAFDPFYTTKNDRRGMGLAAVLGIVRRHRAAVAVDTAPGVGTRMRLAFPAAPRGAAAVRGTRAGTPTGRRVLLADDEVSLLEMARRGLEAAGFEVVLAQDGREALDAFDAGPGAFDVVILDIVMPRLDGGRVFEAIRRRRPDTPVVLISGYDPEDAGRHFGARPGVRFLRKPFGPAELVGVVESLLPSGSPATP